MIDQRKEIIVNAQTARLFSKNGKISQKRIDRRFFKIYNKTMKEIRKATNQGYYDCVIGSNIYAHYRAWKIALNKIVEILNDKGYKVESYIDDEYYVIYLSWKDENDTAV